MMHLRMKRFNAKFIVSFSLAAVLLSCLIYATLYHTSRKSIESHALIIADIVARNATASRSVYTNDIVNKLQQDGFGPHTDSDMHPGFVPIPAQYLKMIAKATSEKNQHLFSYKPVSKWNIADDQGLDDDFLVWAWEQLELQDIQSPAKEIDWQPIWRFEENSGSGVLRFLYADPATSETCIACHNAYEKTPSIIARRNQQNVPIGKTWEENQLLGALSITVPLDGVERITSDQVNKTTILLTIILSLLFLISSLFYRRNKIQQYKIRSLDWEANHDPLTELLNRRGFEEKYRVHKNVQVTNAIICFIDLDKFKSVNDAYGHNVGDHLLKTIALNLRNAVASTDYIIRLGGDEFAVVLFNVAKEQEKDIGEQLLNVINESKVYIEGTTISVSASIGIGTFNPISNEYSDFLDQADKASYQAKQNGCNRVVICNS